MCEQNALHMAKHSENGSKNLSKICVKIIQNALKQSLRYVNFQKFFGEACPRTPISLLVSQSASNLFCRKKKTLEKNVEIMPSPSPKISRYATGYIHCKDIKISYRYIIY